uniref:Uncharacterized protein n=1 Tax=Anguilla anguilla TaxID=7936 RepID=A0A0E9W7I1_ANGAN
MGYIVSCHSNAELIIYQTNLSLCIPTKKSVVHLKGLLFCFTLKHFLFCNTECPGPVSVASYCFNIFHQF